MNTLRPYQREALEAIGREYVAGVDRQLVALPTGTGRTALFASLPGAGFCRLLALAHLEELLGQEAEKIAGWNPGLSVAIDRDEQRPPVPTGEVFAVVASVAKVGRRGSPRLSRYPSDTFEAVVSTDLLGRGRVSLTRRVEGRDVVFGDLSLPFFAEGVREAEARLLDGAPPALANPHARWRSDPASEKQLAALRRFRFPTRPNLTKGDAGILLEKAFARMRAR